MSIGRVYKSKLWLRKKYVEEHLTEQEIADLAGTSQPTIHTWLVKYGLRRKR